MIEDAREILKLVDARENEGHEPTHNQILLHDAVRSLCHKIIAREGSDSGQMSPIRSLY